VNGTSRQASERRIQFKVGVFVVVALVSFLGLVYLLGARARLFEARYTIHADFTEVGGLVEGATVRLAGVQIGRVTGIHLPGKPGGKVRVDMSIAKQYGDRIRTDSTARIDTQGLLGDKIIEITVGSAHGGPVAPGDVVASRDPTDIGQVMSQGAETVKSVAAVAESLRGTAEALQRSNLIGQASATVADARRTVDQVGQDVGGLVKDARRVTKQAERVFDQVEKGQGWAHALLYDEPVALRQLDALIQSARATLDRVQRGEGAAGVLTSDESTAAARRLVAAMDRFGQVVERPESGGVLPGLLFDPQYRSVLDDLKRVTHDLREVSDRLAGGRGTLGGLVRDEPPDQGIRQASSDLQQTLANLKSITEKVNEGEGTLGALIADPTLYERMVTILDGAQRSFLLRMLLRGLGGDGSKPAAGPKGGDNGGHPAERK
jgi:phospholipid/cholesterol/gamma-HCH transport system substrate-binding protein